MKTAVEMKTERSIGDRWIIGEAVEGEEERGGRREGCPGARVDSFD